MFRSMHANAGIGMLLGENQDRHKSEKVQRANLTLFDSVVL